jgi:hypothetical protein
MGIKADILLVDNEIIIKRELWPEIGVGTRKADSLTTIPSDFINSMMLVI